MGLDDTDIFINKKHITIKKLHLDAENPGRQALLKNTCISDDIFHIVTPFIRNGKSWKTMKFSSCITKPFPSQSTFPPHPENIRKLSDFLMFSGSREMVHCEKIS